ncbi:DEAD/DEAH box helicase [Pseudoduganella violacea]|uniref:DEAD-box ATP-dependent RNA helicase RhpA n=1 Tax=Pseudoduganella violacea TaxID=1715466 RepID=A0A7W5FUS3_9BURK|nr:DEAD/DEAH box helicase [Pseudoduganella violacea]MBB3120079.1 superfamily II DNA/RNA helicase [Pseudoduganella violacea]
MSFASLSLIDPLLRTLEELGYDTPTPVQKQAIPAVLAGRDLLAAAQTGTGKTAGFALPLLQRLTMDPAQAGAHAVRCLVLVPTRELAEQVYESFRKYGGKLPLRSYVAYGGVPMEPQIAKLRKGLDVLVATPGRLLDLHRQGALLLDQLQTLVLDEADRMLDLGFSRDLDAVFAAVPKARQTLLFSATFSDAIRGMAAGLLRDPLSIQASPRNTTAKAVRQHVITTDKKSKPELFLHLLRQRGWGQVMVFVKTRKGTDQLVATLQAAGVSADAIHGDKPQPARLRALERFKAGQVQILAATDVAARGLDIQALPLVVNFDLPTVAEDYVHRIGRTGRAGAEGEAISLVCADEVELLRAIETLIRQVLPRTEEDGFEADHRVPSTGTPTAQAGGKPRSGAAKQGKSGATARPAQGAAGANGKSTRPAQPRPASPAAAPARDKSFPARPARSQPGGVARSQAGTGALPQGKVVMAAGRGAKSAAKAAAKSASKAGGRPPKR